MKSTLLILILVVMATACSKGGKTSASFAVTIAGIAAPTGGMIVTGKSNSGEAFSRVMSQDTLGLDLNNGRWNFLIVSWDGTTTFTGKIRCATQRNINLDGQAVDLQFNLTNAHCGESGVAENGHWDSAVTPNANFQTTYFNVCRTSWATITSSAACTFNSSSLSSLRAPIGSVRIFIPSSDVSPNGRIVQQAGGQLLDPSCYESSLPTSAPRLPVFVSDFYFPLTFRGYFKPACAGGSLDALAATDTLKFSDNSSTTRIYTYFSDERICAEADKLSLSALSDIGRGETSHPYGICTLAQLYDWQRNFGTGANYKNAAVYLLSDLNLLAGIRVRSATVTPNAFSQCVDDGSTFAPIGIAVPTLPTCSYTPDASPYSGTFHGLGHTISHFRFRPLKPFVVDDIGLFRELSGGIVYLNLDGVETSGQHNVAGLVGDHSSGFIENVKIKRAQIEGNGTDTGTVAGTSAGALQRIYVTESKVRGKNAVGGIAGSATNLTDVSYHGFIDTSDDSSASLAGGLAGTVTNITRGVSGGLVHGQMNVGGLAGTSTGTIQYSRSTMSVISSKSSVPVHMGGLVGDASSGAIQFSFFAGSMSTICAGACLIGEMKGTGSATVANTWSAGLVTGFSGSNGASTAAGDTTQIYGKDESTICPGNDCTSASTEWNTSAKGMPRLEFEDTVCDDATNLLDVSVQAASPYWRGSEANPIIICNYLQLADIDGVTGHIRLEEDIYVDAADIYAAQIDIASNLNGNGRFVYGARLSNATFNLFTSILDTATVRNLHMANFVITSPSQSNISALALDNEGKIQGVRGHELKLQGLSEVAGLVINNKDSGDISHSSTSGKITTDNGMAGLVQLNEGTIINSLSDIYLSTRAGYSSSISNPVGGIAGRNTSTGTLSKVEFRGYLTLVGTSTVDVIGGAGGIVGLNEGNVEDVLVSDYSAILTTIDTDNVIGGLVGINHSTVTRGVNLGTVYNTAAAAAAPTARTIVGSSTGTETSVFASRGSLNFFSNNTMSPAASTASPTCSAVSGLSSNSDYYLLFYNDTSKFFDGTSNGSITTYNKDVGTDCVTGTFDAYRPFASDIFTAATLSNVFSPLALSDFGTDTGAAAIKTAYTNYLTNGSITTSIVWTWDEGKPQLFRFDDDK